MLCTDDKYVPNLKKVVVSKKEIQSNNKELLEYLKLDEEEKKKILKNNIWQGNISRE